MNKIRLELRGSHLANHITVALADSLVKTDANIVNKVPDNLTVAANNAYLDSILKNLITNAIKYRPRRVQYKLLR